MDIKRFSIIIPVYNGASTLKECLMAVARIKYPKENYEVIIIDDNSNDKTGDIIKEFPSYRIIRNKLNLGQALSRNIGSLEAKGEFLFFVDSDIVLPDNVLELADDYLVQKKIKVFFCTFSKNMRHLNISSQYKNLYLCYYYLAQSGKIHAFDTSFAFIQKKLFLDIGGFEVKTRGFGEDIELGMKIASSGNEIFINNVIQAEHLKKYTLKSLIKTDFNRGKEISMIFLKNFMKNKSNNKKPFSLKPLNIYINMPLSFIIVIIIIGALVNSRIFILPLFIGAFLFFLANANFWFFILRNKNIIFLLKAVGITLIDSLVMGVGTAFSLMAVLSKRNMYN